jgi:hypothetical protein
LLIPYKSVTYSLIVHDDRTDQFPEPIIATLSLPMMEDDVNLRVRVRVVACKIDRSGYERYARDRTDIERRDVMAAFADRYIRDGMYKDDVVDKVTMSE